jgi:hypothetical protein
MAMLCDEADLIALHDNELLAAEKQEVQLHVNSCESCQKELGSIDSTMALLGQYWNSEQANCPATEKLIGYHEGTLDPQPKDAISEHLDDCSDCKRLVELLADLGDAPSFEELDDQREPLPPRVRVALDEVRRDSLAARLKKTLETVLTEGKEQLKKAPGVVSQMVDDLMSPREPDAAPSLAAPKNAAEVKEESGGSGDAESGKEEDKGTRGDSDKEPG